MTDDGRGERGTGSVEEVSTVLARRIASFRQSRQLSFDALAARSGVSKGALVQIEQGRANPSIGTLCKLAAALHVGVVDLISESEAAKSPVRVVAPGAMPVLWKGPKGGSARLVVGSEGPDMFELWQWVVMPGERFESKAHTPGTLELIHVTEGSLTLEVSDVPHVLTRGASAFAQTDRSHAYTCSGNKKTRFTMAVLEHPSES